MTSQRAYAVTKANFLLSFQYAFSAIYFKEFKKDMNKERAKALYQFLLPFTYHIYNEISAHFSYRRASL